jgi:hypothetical protein
MVSNPPASERFSDDALMAATLAVLGTLEARGWTVLLHSDPTVAVASALNCLEQRPEVLLERESGPAGGARIIYIPVGADEPDASMLRRPIIDPDISVHEGDSRIALADILRDAGLLRPEPNDFRSALYQHRPEAVLAVMRRSDRGELESAMEIAEVYANQTGALLFASHAQDRWSFLEDVLTPEQRETGMPPLSDEEGDVRREGDARSTIERAAVDTARISLSIERTILRLLNELE